MKHLVLGGARSGKSRFALELAQASNKTLFYLATAQARDGEMSARIARHRGERDARWTLLEEPVKLTETMLEVDDNKHLILVDCLTLWLSNCLEQNCWEQEKQQLLSAFDGLQADIILVSNDVGSGVIPMAELSRLFVDESGWLHQDLARACSHVTNVVAGLPQTLKEPSS